VSDVIATFGWREERECGRDERVDVVEGTGSCRAKKRFQFGKRLLDGIEIGTVGRKKPQRGADRGDRGVDFGLAVHGQVIEDHDVARTQGRHEDLLDVGEKAAVVDGPIKHCRCGEALRPQRGDNGMGFPVAVGGVIVQATTTQTASVPPEQVRCDAAFIHEHPLTHIAQRQPAAPVAAFSGDVRPSLFVGVDRFF
jgi:hypothetical protein